MKKSYLNEENTHKTFEYHTAYITGAVFNSI